MGDTVETPFPVVPSKNCLPQWISELQRWEQDLRVKTVIPSHGIIRGREILQQNRMYLQKLLVGGDIKIPNALTGFYSETHKSNLRVVHNEL